MWLDTNSMLFQHALKYDDMLSEILCESSNSLQAQRDRIWDEVFWVVDGMGVPSSVGMETALHLLHALGDRSVYGLGLQTPKSGLLG